MLWLNNFKYRSTDQVKSISLYCTRYTKCLVRVSLSKIAREGVLLCWFCAQKPDLGCDIVFIQHFYNNNKHMWNICVFNRVFSSAKKYGSNWKGDKAVARQYEHFKTQRLWYVNAARFFAVKEMLTNVWVLSQWYNIYGLKSVHF